MRIEEKLILAISHFPELSNLSLKASCHGVRKEIPTSFLMMTPNHPEFCEPHCFFPQMAVKLLDTLLEVDMKTVHDQLHNRMSLTCCQLVLSYEMNKNI